jgi:myo-inositol-1(or 4)-monophosphatase
MDLARRAGDIAARYFVAFEALDVEQKGYQDLVSNADRDVEAFIRAEIAQSFPGDAVIGEEEAATHGSSGWVWVIDPIDGTGNFVRGIPCWCVAIVIVRAGEAVVAVTRDPVAGETFHAVKGGGAFVNGRAMHTAAASSMSEGSVGVGLSNRRDMRNAVRLAGAIVERGGLFQRNGSGALSLAYVAAGRLLAYCEEHMNAWDCLGGLLMVKEAGGRVRDPDPATALADGTMVVASCEGLFGDVTLLCERAFSG